jgi:predicted aspartyl protease
VIHRRANSAIAVALMLSASACQPKPPEPPVPDRSYLLRRNAVDPTKPCLIAKFAVVPLKLFHNIAFVPVKVNDVFTYGILDTGSDGTLLTPAMVKAAKIAPDPKQRPYRAYGMAGGFSMQVVLADSFQIGGLKLTHPNPSGVVDFVNSNNEKVGALIGSNLIGALDWDIDFTSGQMTSYETQNCHDIDPLWETKSTGVPLTRGTDRKFTALANLLGLNANVTLPVEFDGGSLTAVFDTGTGQSYLTREGAHKAGITNAQLDRDPIVVLTAINGKTRKVRRHTVSEFVVGEDLQRNFPVEVAEYFNRNDQYDMILGMDWIARHHIWLSYTTDSLYIDSGEKKPPAWRPTPKTPD